MIENFNTFIEVNIMNNVLRSQDIHKVYMLSDFF